MTAREGLARPNRNNLPQEDAPKTSFINLGWIKNYLLNATHKIASFRTSVEISIKEQAIPLLHILLAVDSKIAV